MPFVDMERKNSTCTLATPLDRGVSSDANIRTIGAKNTSGFSKFMVCLHEQGEGSVFRYFVQTSFKDV